MESSQKLNAEELDALIDGMPGQTSTDVDYSTISEMAYSFDFRSGKYSQPEDFPALEIINERFSQYVRATFAPMLRVQPRITTLPLRIITFGAYRSGLDSFVSLTTSRIEELRGIQMIAIKPSFISTLTDAYYGGRVQHLKTTRTEFTNTEKRVIEVVTSGINNVLGKAWEDLADLTFTAQTHEENLQMVPHEGDDEMVVASSFTIELPDTESAGFDILYPLSALKPLYSRLRSGKETSVTNDSLGWRGRMENAVLSIPLTVTAQISETSVPLHELINIRPGQVVAIQPGEEIDIMVGDRKLFGATMGELGSQAAVKITKQNAS